MPELQVQQQQVPQELRRLLQDRQVDKVDRQARQQLQVLRLARRQGRRLPQLLREPLVLVSSYGRQELLVPLELQLLVQVLQLKLKINVSQENMNYWKVEAQVDHLVLQEDRCRQPLEQEPLLLLLLDLLQVLLLARRRGLVGTEERRRRRRGAGESWRGETLLLVRRLRALGRLYGEWVRLAVARPDLCHLISESTSELWTLHQPLFKPGTLKRCE